MLNYQMLKNLLNTTTSHSLYNIKVLKKKVKWEKIKVAGSFLSTSAKWKVFYKRYFKYSMYQPSVKRAICCLVKQAYLKFTFNLNFCSDKLFTSLLQSILRFRYCYILKTAQMLLLLFRLEQAEIKTCTLDNADCILQRQNILVCDTSQD